jgi:hypothetical protein
MKKSALIFLPFALALLLALAASAPAQSVTGLLTGTNAKNPSATSTDQLGRSNPSGTVLGFLQTAQSGSYEAAADYLQMSAVRRQSQGADLAMKLKLLMDRAFIGKLTQISDRPEGNSDNGIPDQQTIGIFSVPTVRIATCR